MALKATGNLVPIIYKEEFDDEATAFLKKYYPEALVTPITVPILEIAKEGMRLTVMSRNLTEDLSTFGQMCFTEGLAEIYDKDEDEYREISIKGGTMIIDPDTFFQRNIGCMNNTIAHECFHWHRHRNYHFMQNLLEGKQSVACRCPVEAKDERFKEKWTDEDWMEWQASGIAPKILLPKETFGLKVDQFLKESKKNPFIAAELMSPKQWVIDQLADFYKVSKISVRIRLDELGICRE
ncbi:MAG TPA: hypothetical protein DCG34_05850 [Clostridiales bacterium]|jgi:hypothetical protein|nr:hypothetical protein [Clostridiales bacterium]